MSKHIQQSYIDIFSNRYDMDAATTVEVVGGEGGAGNSGGGDMAASVTSIMENSKDAMAELFQDEAEVGNQNDLKLP